MEKALEIVLYNTVAIVTGMLVTREKKEKERHLNTARSLEKSLVELKQTKQDLLQAEKLSAIGQLSAGLAHEIRNPLSSIKGAVNILAVDYPPEHKKHRMLKVLDCEADRLNKVLTAFLSFAKPQPLQSTRINLINKVEEVIGLLKMQAVSANIEIIRDFADSPPLIKLDEGQMGRVFLNIMLNAMQAMPDGGKLTVSIKKAILDKKEGLQLNIGDTGCGIKPEDMSDIFNPFFTTKSNGTGLGLAICYRIIKEHQGNIKITSRPQQGTLVSLWIPIES